MSKHNELGPVLDAEGKEVKETKESLETERVIEFADPNSGNKYKAKIDLIRVTRAMENNFGMAAFHTLKESGLSEADLENLTDEDPRAMKLLELQATSPRLNKFAAEIGARVFVAWNSSRPAPTADDLLNLGGIYGAYLDAVIEAYRPTARRSEADAATK